MSEAAQPKPRAVRTPGEAAQPKPRADEAVAPAAAPAPSQPLALTQAGGADELPNAIDVDPKKIRGPVLTKQGWVCPDETGRTASDSFKP